MFGEVSAMYRVVRTAVTLAFATALVVSAAGCDVTKSENPTSPSVAGAIAGVNITTPALVDPPAGKRFDVTQLPVTLTVQNSSTNGQRTVKYVFDVASDAAFTAKVIDAASVTQGDNGQTKYTIDKGLEAGKTYYWRAKADDGANQSAPAAAKDFAVYTLSISTPVQIYPTANMKVAASEAPVTLTIQNSTTNGERALRYIFEVATDPSFNTRVYGVEVASGGNDRTQLRVDTTLEYARIYYWRARATDGVAQSAWSNAYGFSVDAPVVVTPPSTPTTPSGGGSTPAANDAIDLRSVTWALGENLTNWAVTSTMTGGGWSNGELCTPHTMAGRWPTAPFFGDYGTLIEGNQIVFAKIGGKWYGGSGEWLRPGQTCKGVPSNMGPDTFYNASGPLSYWIPQSGEWYGLAVSMPSRAGVQTGTERSNVILVQWR
jgi:hypothetical protein